jgi:CDP-4-dehydro-6-deoxyglucose reductase, E3
MTFHVTLQPSGATFQVGRDASILGAAMAAGVGLPYGCKEGACGSCKCKIIQGRVIHGAHLAQALSTQEEQEGYVLTCCAAAQTDVVLQARTVSGLGDFPVKKMPCRVMRITKPAPDVAVLELQLPSHDALRYRPGQYIELALPSGVRRCYSLANAPRLEAEKPSIELHIRWLAGGQFSTHVFEQLKEKDILRLEGPLGTFFLREDSLKPMILLASGTGFAPIKAIIEHMKQTQCDRSAVLYWGVRSRVDLYDHEWMIQAQQALPTLGYVPVLSQPLVSDNKGSERTGFVHQAVLADYPDLSGYQVYACGAPVVVSAAQRDFTQQAHLPADEFFADAFTAHGTDTPRN